MRRILATLLLPLGSMGLAFGATPNVLILLADDLGYNDVNYPNMDALKRDGITFTDGYVASPLCFPSRAGLITGLHPSKIGLFNNYREHDGLPLGIETVADRLRNLGYVTAAIGKWHLGDSDDHSPLRRGFDHHYNPDVPMVYYERHRYARPSHFTNDGLYVTDLLTDRAIQFMDGSEHPFFLYLSFWAPHVPLEAPVEILKEYMHIEDESRRTYVAMVRSIDDNIGRLMDSLKDSGKYRDTMIFFLSDNGGVFKGDKNWADNSPLRAGKESLYEGGIRVPFIGVYPAKWPPGIEYRNIVSSLDIVPTVLMAAGASPETLDGMDGENLSPYVLNEKRYVNRTLYWDLQGGSIMSAIRSGDHKVVYDDGTVTFFNLRVDISESQGSGW